LNVRDRTPCTHMWLYRLKYLRHTRIYSLTVAKYSITRCFVWSTARGGGGFKRSMANSVVCVIHSHTVFKTGAREQYIKSRNESFYIQRWCFEIEAVHSCIVAVYLLLADVIFYGFWFSSEIVNTLDLCAGCPAVSYKMLVECAPQYSSHFLQWITNNLCFLL